ncbi:PP2C family serine/threonine-protein phosphatase [Actinomadura sp. DC4]|uniref:PP2C family protein-serine/threonine phosphatase n=1 Tax=Actinomadura sp. DC4 TaxID=3055069 RepID=UPI0025AF2B21|nr:PP2C family serine/threonine-protein phosphatase [Actinomadura sp. DC4]MDN3360063.1 serine/threonine-protein phosphatase [Actinomadura sp. DC4]
MSGSLSFAVGSDGVISVNDDAVYAGPCLLALASGLSVMAGPGVPAGVAIEKLRPLDIDGNPSEIGRALSDSFERVGRALYDLIESEPLLHGMATSLTAILRHGCNIAISHIGDSRAYILREYRLSQLTQEHTVARKLLDEGKITHADLVSDPRASWLTRVIDGSGEVRVDLEIRRAEPGDRYLLCSRSLWKSVPFESIAHILSSESTPQKAVDVLIRTARQRDSRNTVTCVVADFVVGGNAPPREPVTAGAALKQVMWPHISS